MMAARKKVTKKTRKKTAKKASGSKSSPKPAAPRRKIRKSASKQDVLLALMGQLNEVDGTTGEPHTVITFADRVPNTYEIRRPSGIMQLDIDTGGGIPAGGLTYLAGPEGAGKTHLLYKYMAWHQRLYGGESCLGMCSAETQFDWKRALECGMQVRVPKEMVEQWREQRFQRNLPDFTKEEMDRFKFQVGEFMFIGGDTGEESMGVILEAVKTGIFGIIGLDSVNGLLPAALAAKDLDEADKVAAHATLMTRFLSRYVPLARDLDNRNETTLVFIQQVRANPAKKSAQPNIAQRMKDWGITGSWAERHFKLIHIMVSTGKKIDRQVNKVKSVVGKELCWDITKGKAGTHDNIQGSVPFYYQGGIDDTNSAIVTGTRLGVIREMAKGVQIVVPETGEPADLGEIPDIPTLRKMMLADVDFDVAVRREILAAKEISCLYR